MSPARPALVVLGSSDPTVSLVRIGLVDEVRIVVDPIVLGAGRSLLHYRPAAR